MNTKEETTINDRVQQIINHYNLNKNSFSKKIGLSGNMTITNIVSGRKNKPSYDVLRKIAEAFPINLHWLILGEGHMLLDAEDELERESKMDKIRKIANDIVQSPEKYEKDPVFAKYLENERNKAIITHQDEFLFKFKKSDLDRS